VSILARETDGKRQDILIEAVPGLRLMAVLTDVNYTKYATLEALQEAARAQYRVFNSSCRQSRGDRGSYRQCASIRRCRAKHLGLSLLPQLGFWAGRPGCRGMGRPAGLRILRDVTLKTDAALHYAHDYGGLQPK
jgi:hypothetical protein